MVRGKRGASCWIGMIVSGRKFRKGIYTGKSIKKVSDRSGGGM